MLALLVADPHLVPMPDPTERPTRRETRFLDRSIRFSSAATPNVGGIATLVVAVLSCASLDASAQTLVGTVSYAESGQPIAAALVEAESETGTRIGGMTRLDGGYPIWRVVLCQILKLPKRKAMTL